MKSDPSTPEDKNRSTGESVSTVIKEPVVHSGTMIDGIAPPDCIDTLSETNPRMIRIDLIYKRPTLQSFVSQARRKDDEQTSEALMHDEPQISAILEPEKPSIFRIIYTGAPISDDELEFYEDVLDD